MNIALVVVAIVIAAAGFGCLYLRTRTNAEMALMAATQTSRAADVSSLAPGTLVEVKGSIRCNAPLTGQFTQASCVHVRTLIKREEVRYDDKQQRQTSYIPESDVVETVPFMVEDDSGRVRVDPKGAKIEPRDVFNESRSSMADNFLTVAATISGGGGVTHRYREWMLPLDHAVYVLGTVQTDGSIGAAPPSAALRNFVVSVQTEEERAADSQFWATALVWIAAALFVGAAYVFYRAFQ